MITTDQFAVRLSREAEQAICELLRRRGGMAGSNLPLFRFGWAEEDNRGRVLPFCFTNQKSYHVMIWEPPSLALKLSENQTEERYDKGTYNCILHFLDERGLAMNPNRVFAAVAENVIPAIDTIRSLVHSGHFGHEMDKARAELAAINLRREQQERQQKQTFDEIVARTKDAIGNPEEQVGYTGKPRKEANAS